MLTRNKLLMILFIISVFSLSSLKFYCEENNTNASFENNFFGNEIMFLELLSNKNKALFSDAVIAFCYLSKFEVSPDFENNLTNLKTKIKYFPKKYSAEKQLTIGDFSLLAMQYLGLKSGMFYLLSKTGRYASRELVLLEIIPINYSEHEKLSGRDLIRYIQKVIEYEDKK
jgi:hypothetical protein